MNALNAYERIKNLSQASALTQYWEKGVQIIADKKIVTYSHVYQAMPDILQVVVVCR